ncbi:unnamed protein product [Toxocara canis]|uniref:Saposin B-type domain-containing protein n=1 Tax=Toxocara canis TaxID=6265 RepID=A0A183UU06_TOXCA|nr:unnamed protein product [Toxocara canis]
MTRRTLKEQCSFGFLRVRTAIMMNDQFVCLLSLVVVTGCALQSPDLHDLPNPKQGGASAPVDFMLILKAADMPQCVRNCTGDLMIVAIGAASCRPFVTATKAICGACEKATACIKKSMCKYGKQFYDMVAKGLYSVEQSTESLGSKSQGFYFFAHVRSMQSSDYVERDAIQENSVFVCGIYCNKMLQLLHFLEFSSVIYRACRKDSK